MRSPWLRFTRTHRQGSHRPDGTTRIPPPVYPARSTHRVWGIAVGSSPTCWQPVAGLSCDEHWQVERLSISIIKHFHHPAYLPAQPSGQRVASPGAAPGDQGAVRHSRGTSNATALVSRACGLFYDVMDELRQEPGGEIVDSLPRAVWLKALVAHGAEWGEAGSILARLLRNQDNSRQFKEYTTRLLGYGAVDVNRVQECTARRVTALGGGTLGQDESHVHRFPLPPSLSGRRGHRRLTVTLAWLSPVNQRHQVPSAGSASSEPATSRLAGSSAWNPATRDPGRRKSGRVRR